MKLAPFEIMDKIKAAKDDDEKIRILKENDSELLRKIIQIAYDVSLTTLLPDSIPEWNKSDIKGGEGILYREHRKIGMFVKGAGHDAMNQSRREVLFIQMIESIDPRDSLVLIQSIINRKPFDNLELETIKAAWPGFME